MYILYYVESFSEIVLKTFDLLVWSVYFYLVVSKSEYLLYHLSNYLYSSRKSYLVDLLLEEVVYLDSVRKTLFDVFVRKLHYNIIIAELLLLLSIYTVLIELLLKFINCLVPLSYTFMIISLLCF